MNQRDLLFQRRKVWHSYHVPGLGKYTTRPFNGIFLSPSNSLAHEMEKCKQCYALLEMKQKFITEAVCNKTDERADIVVLDTGRRIEIETDPKRAARFKGRPDVDVVPLWEEK